MFTGSLSTLAGHLVCLVFQRMYIFTAPKNMPCSVCFNSKTSKLEGHLSTLVDKLLFILLENTNNCSLRFYKLRIILQTETTRAVTHTGLRTEILGNFIFRNHDSFNNI